MPDFQSSQAVAQKMKDEEEISDHQRRINDEFDRKGSQSSQGLFLHCRLFTRTVLPVGRDFGNAQIPLRLGSFLLTWQAAF